MTLADLLAALAALAALIASYATPPPADPAPMPAPVVIWQEGPATLTGRHLEDGPNSTRLHVDSIDGQDTYTVRCDTVTAYDIEPALAIALLNGPDACRVIG